MNGTQWYNTVLMYYIQYEKGFLPEDGGLNAQPAKFPELMTTFGYIYNSVSEEARKRERRNHGNGSRQVQR